MGLTASWFGVQGDAAPLLERLGFAETGGAGDWLEYRLSYAVMPSGWTIVISTDPELATPTRLPALLSVPGKVVGCEVVESVNYCRAWGLQDGQPQWSAEHDPNEGLFLELKGDFPPEFAAIQDGLAKEQEADEDTDYLFDGPKDMVESVCGFHPEKVEYDPPEPGFREVAVPRRAGDPPQSAGDRPGPLAWLGRLFSGR